MLIQRFDNLVVGLFRLFLISLGRFALGFLWMILLLLLGWRFSGNMGLGKLSGFSNFFLASLKDYEGGICRLAILG